MTWVDDAYAEIERLARSGVAFTSDDLLVAMAHPDQSHSPNSRNNAIGVVFGRASRNGLIQAIGVKQSTQPHRKKGMVRVWRGI